MPTVRAELEAFRKEFAAWQVSHAERQTKIETLLVGLHTELKGNGQPGRCDKHDSRLGDLEQAIVKIGTILDNMQNYGDRLDRLEQERARLHGIMAAIGTLTGAAGAATVWALDKIKYLVR